MTVKILHEKGRLICDGEDKGPVEYNISFLFEGPGYYSKGTMWADPLALTDAMSATDVKLSSDEREGLVSIQVKNIRGDGEGEFVVTGKPSF